MKEEEENENIRKEEKEELISSAHVFFNTT
jgi:hypothetical protein